MNSNSTHFFFLPLFPPFSLLISKPLPKICTSHFATTINYYHILGYNKSVLCIQLSHKTDFTINQRKKIGWSNMGMAAEPQFHVLAVDDSLIDRKLIERLLKTSSYQVTTVDSGNKALEFLGLQVDNQQEVEVNLIITDYCMPGMTGYDLLKKVKESSLFRNIPVVIMSSENVPSRINRCLEEGAEEFFLKPVRLSDVNRLRPHLLRAKYGQQHQQNVLQERRKPELNLEQQQKQPQQLTLEQQNVLKDCRKPELNSEQQQEAQQIQSEQQYVLVLEECQKPEIKSEQERPSQQPNNKRKSMEEGLSPDRTRPRYNDLTTVV